VFTPRVAALAALARRGRAPGSSVESHTPSEAGAARRAAHLSNAALRGGVRAGWCVRRWWRDVARFRVEGWYGGRLVRQALATGGWLGLG
jgi:hypothetical protein